MNAHIFASASGDFVRQTSCLDLSFRLFPTVHPSACVQTGRLVGLVDFTRFYSGLLRHSSTPRQPSRMSALRTFPSSTSTSTASVSRHCWPTSSLTVACSLLSTTETTDRIHAVQRPPASLLCYCCSQVSRATRGLLALCRLTTASRSACWTLGPRCTDDTYTVVWAPRLPMAAGASSGDSADGHARPSTARRSVLLVRRRATPSLSHGLTPSDSASATPRARHGTWCAMHYTATLGRSTATVSARPSPAASASSSSKAEPDTSVDCRQPRVNLASLAATVSAATLVRHWRSCNQRHPTSYWNCSSHRVSRHRPSTSSHPRCSGRPPMCLRRSLRTWRTCRSRSAGFQRPSRQLRYGRCWRSQDSTKSSCPTTDRYPTFRQCRRLSNGVWHAASAAPDRLSCWRRCHRLAALVPRRSAAAREARSAFIRHNVVPVRRAAGLGTWAAALHGVRVTSLRSHPITWLCRTTSSPTTRSDEHESYDASPWAFRRLLISCAAVFLAQRPVA